MKAIVLFLILCVASILCLLDASGQVGVNSTSSSPDPSSMLDVSSTTRGLLIPRMTATQRNAISQPATGLMIFCTDDEHFYVNKGTPASPEWNILSSQWTSNANGIYYNGGYVGINADPNTSYRLRVDGGGTAVGVYGQFNASHYGYLGTSSHGVAGYNTGASQLNSGVYGNNSSVAIGTHGIYGYNANNANGTGYYMDLSSNGVLGYVLNGYPYHFGVFGTRYDDGYGPSAGVIGTVNYSDQTKPWGALGFQDASLNEYAGYFSGNINITGGVKDGTGYGTNGSVLVSNGSNDVAWSASAGTTGSGTFNYIPKWSGATNLTNGNIYDGAVHVSIGTTGLIGKFNVLSTDNLTAIWGQFNTDIYGCLGSATNGAYGQYNVNSYGYLGSVNYGVYGYHSTPGGAAGYFVHNNGPASFSSQWATDAYMLNSGANDGSSYAYNATGYNSGGIRSYNYWGANYTFGVAGWNYNDHNRCAGVFGARYDAYYWGALGYKDSGSNGYGGYFTSYTSGAGKSAAGQGSSEGIGIGAWGGLIGADIHGGVYGLYVEGENFGIYSRGPVFSDQPAVQLQNVGERERAVTYSSASTEATISVAGQGALVNGQGYVEFDANFRKVISGQVPVIITVTPLGPSNGVFITSSDENGFTLAENNGGSSTVGFYYMAVGRRAGYENPQLPAEVLSSDFEKTMKEGLHNDADMTTSGKGIYYEFGRLNAGQSATMRAPAK